MRRYRAVFRDERWNIVGGLEFGTYNPSLDIDDITRAVTYYTHKIGHEQGLSRIEWELFDEGSSDRSMDRDGIFLL